MLEGVCQLQQAEVPQSDLPRLVTIDEAAAYLKCSRSHLYELVAAGRLPGVVRVGKLIRVDLNAIIHREAADAS